MYPLRMTKSRWKIPVYIHHRCSEDCTPENCNNQDRIEPGPIKIADFDFSDNGLLFNGEEVVIPDRKFDIRINYPLSFPVDVNIDFGHDNITRRELLSMISVLYKLIYQEEERTSQRLVECQECKGSDILDSVEKVDTTDSDDCSICFTEYNSDNVVKLPCDHLFHKECIEKWLKTEDKENNSCPLCRDVVLKCDGCNGERLLTHNQNNIFGGYFGIYHELENITIKEIMYNRNIKRVSLSME